MTRTAWFAASVRPALARKFALALLTLVAGLFLTAAGLALGAATPLDLTPDRAAGLIRLHVVANSDTDEDQAAKRAVRDAILAEVTPLFEQAATVEEAREAISRSLPEIEAAAVRVLGSRAKGYAAAASLGRFSFPGRAYGAVYLPAGEYEALRVVLGAGAGANWWCVLFPPLCFVDWATGIVLEPRPGSGGAETVAVARREAVTASGMAAPTAGLAGTGAVADGERLAPRPRAVALLDEERLVKAPVRARSAALTWLRSKLGVLRRSGTPPRAL